MFTTMGLVHPGAMGASVGAAAKASGARVVWASEGRSPETKVRAEADGLEDVGTLAQLVRESDLIVSVCPPSAAVELARQIVGASFRGVYLDANAISPATARTIAELVREGGSSFVDGGIIGPPARERGTTRLYLSGTEAERVAGVFANSALEAIAIGDEPGNASALKMAYAAWSKGTSALLLAIRALASKEGVEAELLSEWALSQPELTARSDAVLTKTPAKAWRFAGEMREIAATFGAAGLPEGFHQAAAHTYEQLTDFKDVAEADRAEVLEALLKQQDEL
jgi:3-hydroxyisobutyrate dehydrogenase-like beta-hydroxyacid dehydrogenase